MPQVAAYFAAEYLAAEIGWAAVAVDGFIPPNAFMEFQAYNVLVIATVNDIKKLPNTLLDRPGRFELIKEFSIQNKMRIDFNIIIICNFSKQS